MKQKLGVTDIADTAPRHSIHGGVECTSVVGLSCLLTLCLPFAIWLENVTVGTWIGTESFLMIFEFELFIYLFIWLISI